MLVAPRFRGYYWLDRDPYTVEWLIARRSGCDAIRAARLRRCGNQEAAWRVCNTACTLGSPAAGSRRSGTRILWAPYPAIRGTGLGGVASYRQVVVAESFWLLTDFNESPIWRGTKPSVPACWVSEKASWRSRGGVVWLYCPPSVPRAATGSCASSLLIVNCASLGRYKRCWTLSFGFNERLHGNGIQMAVR